MIYQPWKTNGSIFAASPACPGNRECIYCGQSGEMQDKATDLGVKPAPAGRHAGSHAAAACLAAIAGIVAASSCCLPVFPFVLAAGLAGGSAFLDAARPYLLAGSLLFLAYGFYQVRRARQCRQRGSLMSMVVLWASAVFVFLSIFFPQLMANAAAGLLAR